jgi:hypothetical protein
MAGHWRLVETARRIRDPLYLVTALYVVVGLCIGGYGAYSGDRLAAFLGFFFISGALCAAFVFQGMARLALQISTMADGLEHVRRAVERLERDGARLPAGHEAEDETDVEATSNPWVELISGASPDPSMLAGARLDRDTLPRLALAGAIPEERKPAAISPDSDATHRRLLRSWTVARRADDLPAMRSVLEAVPESVDAATRAEMNRQWSEAVHRVERSLRADFANRVRRGDFAGALNIGRQLGERLPGSPAAQEFERLRPVLARKAAAVRA